MNAYHMQVCTGMKVNSEQVHPDFHHGYPSPQSQLKITYQTTLESVPLLTQALWIQRYLLSVAMEVPSWGQ